jgi:DNA-binding transcriptional regulator YiaG
MKKAHTQIKEYLREKGMTQAVFAREIGITKEQTSRVLCGYVIPRGPARKLISIVTGLDVADASAWEVVASPAVTDQP